MRLFTKISVISVLLLILSFLTLFLNNFVNHRNQNEIKEKTQNSLRIVAANINYKNPNKLKTSKLLAELNADILVILEYTGYNLDLSYFSRNGYKTILEKAINSPHGICTLVKDNIDVDGEMIKIPYKSPCQMPFSTIRFTRDNKIISLWGVHTPPPIPICEFKTGETIKELASYISGGRIVKDLGISKKGDFIVMAGDFNMFWFHSAISKLKENGLVDGYSDLHFLPATTWSPFSWFPYFVGLDYVFCSNEFKIINSYIMDIEGSDHSCVITDINFK